MSSPARIFALIVTLACASALSGCLTPRVQPPVSQAVAQARAGAGAKPAACAAAPLETVSPTVVGFAFDEATIPEAGQAPLAAAARWLACNPGVEVVILPDADNHGDAAHLNDLAQRRAQAVAERLRTLGATAATLRILPRRAPDPVTTPHLVINAQGRGW
jgi:outer membrane protein OmpA-like peptidoglycan-associated protein